MNLKFSLIDDSKLLMPHKYSILQLFRSCFGKELDSVLWDWAYCKNPMGSPIVSLCHVDNKLVGHYAVIPVHLMLKGELLPACLSMTTMVDVSFRKYGLFAEQAQQVYARARTSGFRVVFGFPNIKSTPGFRKRLGWVFGPPDYVARVTMDQLAGSSDFRAFLSDSSLVRLAIDDNAFMQWRLSKPMQSYRSCSSLIFKDFGLQEDIVAMDNLPSARYDNTRQYNILLDAAVTDLKMMEIFPYQFGYKALEERYGNLKFKKDMLMSDVF